MGDSVKFCLYPAPTDNAARLRDDISDLIRRMGAGYIWDRGEVSIKLISSPSLGEYLSGNLELGDNMEDEWFLLHLLFKISEQYPSIVIQVEDSDGEFMLIEAAEDLPDWLEPETSENRVFVCRGKVCIIPMEAMFERPKLSIAIKYVREDPFRSYASPKIQKIIQNRIGLFSKGLGQFHHVAKIFVPLSIAAILKQEPGLLAKAVNAFCSCKARSAVSLTSFAMEPYVETLATFSKLHFAKMLFQQYHPPKGYKQMDSSDPQYSCFDLGLKITAGLELLKKDQAVTEKLHAIINQVDQSNPSHYLVSGEEGTLQWMEIDPNTIEEDFEVSKRALQMDETEINQLMEQWNKEFDDPSGSKDEKLLSRSVKGLKEFMEQMSLYEGVDVKNDSDASNGEEDCTDNSDADNSESESGLEENENFIEFEILETLRHDPDLLMRIVEMNAHAGVDNTDLMARLKKFTKVSVDACVPQKGLADIDPKKIEEARMKPERKLPDFIEQQNADKTKDEDESPDDCGIVSEFSSSDEDYGDVAEHTPTLRELFNTVAAKEVILDEPESTSDCEQEKKTKETSSIQEYFDYMDAELAGKLSVGEFSGVSREFNLVGDLDQADLDYNLAQSLVEIRQMQDAAGAAGPSNTLLTSLRKSKK